MAGDCWLVVLVHSIDDFPIRMCDTRDEAKSFVDANPIREGEGLELGWESGPEVMAAYEVAEMDASTPMGFKIWHFVDGKPVEYEIAGWLDK